MNDTTSGPRDPELPDDDDAPDNTPRLMTGDEIADALDSLASIAESLETIASLVPLAMGAAAGNAPHVTRGASVTPVPAFTHIPPKRRG